MVKSIGSDIPLEIRADDFKAWDIDALKDEMLRLAYKDPNVLRQLTQIPVSSYGNHARYQNVLEEGKRRAINFEVAHNYLIASLLKE